MIIGYKATDSEIRCNGYQFVPGEWHVHEGPIKKCESGFHFCRDKNGVFNYYDWPCRIWKVEAEAVENLPLEAGTLAKFVCRRIRLIEEITTEFENKGNNSGDLNSGDKNSGYQNSGDLNSGDRNSGYKNFGDLNSGNLNSGDLNSGNLNSGNLNSGDLNSGDLNSGYGNSGNRNSGDLNSGDLNSGNLNSGYGNSGNYNSGSWNSGDGNACDRSSGFFNTEEQKVISFDEQTNLTYKEYIDKYPIYAVLTNLLQYTAKIDFDQFKVLPGITEEKLENLHKKHLEKRGLL